MGGEWCRELTSIPDTASLLRAPGNPLTSTGLEVRSAGRFVGEMVFAVSLDPCRSV